MIDSGKSLKIAMVQKNITAKEMAAMLEISVQQVSKWRNGHQSMNLKTVERLAGFFDMKVSDFIRLGETDV